MKLDAHLIEKVSKKTNNPYLVVELKISENYTKYVFLDKAEIELIKMFYKN